MQELRIASLLGWALLHIGLVYFVTASGIFTPVRVVLTRGTGSVATVFRLFLYCSACTGFWLGAVEQALGWLPVTTPFIGGAMGMGLGALFALVNTGANTAYQVEQRQLQQTTEPGDDDGGDPTEGEDGEGGEPAADRPEDARGAGAAGDGGRRGTGEPGDGRADEPPGSVAGTVELYLDAPDVGQRVAVLNAELAGRGLRHRVIVVDRDRVELPTLIAPATPAAEDDRH